MDNERTKRKPVERVWRFRAVVIPADHAKARQRL